MRNRTPRTGPLHRQTLTSFPDRLQTLEETLRWLQTSPCERICSLPSISEWTLGTQAVAWTTHVKSTRNVLPGWSAVRVWAGRVVSTSAGRRVACATPTPTARAQTNAVTADAFNCARMNANPRAQRVVPTAIVWTPRYVARAGAASLVAQGTTATVGSVAFAKTTTTAATEKSAAKHKWGAAAAIAVRKPVESEDSTAGPWAQRSRDAD